MLRPFLPFRAKPLKKAARPKTGFADQRTEPVVDELFATTVKATRKPVKYGRVQVSGGLKVLARNGAAR